MKTCGKFAAVTPPAITLMLSAAERNYAVASSGRAPGNNGFGNRGFDGVPGQSGTNPAPNADQKSADVVR